MLSIFAATMNVQQAVEPVPVVVKIDSLYESLIIAAILAGLLVACQLISVFSTLWVLRKYDKKTNAVPQAREASASEVPTMMDGPALPSSVPPVSKIEHTRSSMLSI